MPDGADGRNWMTNRFIVDDGYTRESWARVMKKNVPRERIEFSMPGDAARLPVPRVKIQASGITQSPPAKIPQRRDIDQERREAADRLAVASQAAETAAARDLHAGLASDAHARNGAFTKARDDARAALARHEADVAAIAARNAARAADYARQKATSDAAQQAYADALRARSPRPKAAPRRDMIPIYGQFLGVSIMSRADAERDALAECAKAGKSCRIARCFTDGSSKSKYKYNSCEASYDTGQKRCRGGSGSKVSSQ